MPIPVINNNELLLFGAVGLFPFQEGEYFTSAELAQTLASLGSNADVTVRVNSPGGFATEGLACYWMLKSHQGNVSVVVEGIAASAGSVIAMAGDAVRIAPGALVMIHDASIVTAGTAEQHSKAIEGLNRQSDAYASAYAEKSGKSVSAMRDLMKAETWFTAEEAVAAGLADELDAANDNPEPAAFAYKTYAHAPERIVALADARGWNARSIDRAGIPAPEKEPSMTGQKPTGAPPVDQRARMKAILTSEEAKGRETLAEYLVVRV